MRLSRLSSFFSVGFGSDIRYCNRYHFRSIWIEDTFDIVYDQLHLAILNGSTLSPVWPLDTMAAVEEDIL